MKQKIINFILAYIKLFAKLQLLKIKPTIIGITGSSGKTSTRDAINAIIKSKYKVKVSYKANSETGIPLNILGLTPQSFSVFEWLKLMFLCPIKLITNWEKYDLYLVEMGIDSPFPPKNMAYLLSIFQPNIAVILNAKPVHAEQFDKLIKTDNPKDRVEKITKLIADEKGKIVTTINSKQTAVINIDQKELRELLPSIKAKILSFGEKDTANIKIRQHNINEQGTTFSFEVNHEMISVNLKKQLLPKHFAYTLAAAIAVGIELKVSLQEIKTNLENNFTIEPGKTSIIKGINDSLIIDSSYNASPQPMLDMLSLLEKIEGNKKLALLGDMRELGEITQIEHEKIAKKANKVCDQIFLVGPNMQQFALPKIEKTKVKWFNNAFQAADYIKTTIQKNNILLIKGSQNTLLLEIATEKLMAHPELASKLLPRRGKFWDKKRAELKK